MSGGAGGEKGSMTSTKTPADFLKSIRGRPVVVKLNSGVDYRGILACLDGYMNIAMEQTEEYVNGQLKNKYVSRSVYDAPEVDIKCNDPCCWFMFKNAVMTADCAAPIKLIHVISEKWVGFFSM
ncbi:hypothetical protein NE237_015476 [Protea cynaroides]|uniref:Sm domain-containing protein n=1 Tax=Protea cynaroides TaxID=273540 RepID=A0A9Q0QR38_9MAGN|nr:hypothetical protein NE237_015476 [Protea cynaroides]